MEQACLDAGLDAPRFEELGGRFRVTITASRRGDTVVDDLDQGILDALTEEGMTTSNVAAVIGKSTRTTRARLQKLVERGAVVEIGSGPTDPRRRYYRARRSHKRSHPCRIHGSVRGWSADSQVAVAVHSDTSRQSGKIR